MSWQQARWWCGAALLLSILYGFGLTRVGVLSTDEPRYAAIGQAMAASGDWITPRLWGMPWFEKPALYYWLAGAAYRLGLGPEAGARAPVAILSVLFLIAQWLLLRAEVGTRGALAATFLLATSIGWLAYSQLGLTDLPLAASYAGALLCVFRWLRTRGAWELPAAGVLLGLAVLAKGLVPLVLILPCAWWLRREAKRSILSLTLGVTTAAPWYLLCYAQNGAVFLNEFFWKHHFQRFATEALAHRQPVWFYLPILLAGLFPWSPLIVLLFRRQVDTRHSLMAASIAWGLLFFSLSSNKLPGYLLPLFPAICLLIGVGLAEVRPMPWLLAGCGALVGLLPLVAVLLPPAVSNGLRDTVIPSLSAWMLAAPCLLAAAFFLLERGGRRTELLIVASGVFVLGVGWLKWTTLPVLDEFASARSYARVLQPLEPQLCARDLPRSWEYGLDFYLGRSLAWCRVHPEAYEIRMGPAAKPIVYKVR